MLNQTTHPAQSQPDMDFNRRFGGVARLYGDAGLARFRAAHICVIGVGGVGSWSVEALARSAIGHITMIDLDHLSESNINRQLHALTNTLGQSKVGALSDRIAQINPECKVTLYRIPNPEPLNNFICNSSTFQIIDSLSVWNEYRIRIREFGKPFRKSEFRSPYFFLF